MSTESRLLHLYSFGEAKWCKLQRSSSSRVSTSFNVAPIYQDVRAVNPRAQSEHHGDKRDINGFNHPCSPKKNKNRRKGLNWTTTSSSCCTRLRLRDLHPHSAWGSKMVRYSPGNRHDCQRKTLLLRFSSSLVGLHLHAFLQQLFCIPLKAFS